MFKSRAEDHSVRDAVRLDGQLASPSVVRGERTTVQHPLAQGLPRHPAQCQTWCCWAVGDGRACVTDRFNAVQRLIFDSDHQPAILTPLERPSIPLCYEPAVTIPPDGHRLFYSHVDVLCLSLYCLFPTPALSPSILSSAVAQQQLLMCVACGAS